MLDILRRNISCISVKFSCGLQGPKGCHKHAETSGATPVSPLHQGAEYPTFSGPGISSSRRYPGLSAQSRTPDLPMCPLVRRFVSLRLLLDLRDVQVLAVLLMILCEPVKREEPRWNVILSKLRKPRVRVCVCVCDPSDHREF